MLGALIGDIVGSYYEEEINPGEEFEFLAEDSGATAEGDMAFAFAAALLGCGGDWGTLAEEAKRRLREVTSPDLEAFIDGDEAFAAMCAALCGRIAQTEDEARRLSEIAAEVAYGHPDGAKGAETVAMVVYLAKTGATKPELRARIERDYFPVGLSLREMRAIRELSEGRELIPQAVTAFLDSSSFEDAIRGAVLLGGESGTRAAIAGAVAEAYYGVDAATEKAALKFFDAGQRGVCRAWERYAAERNRPRKLRRLTKFIGKLGESLDDFHAEFYQFHREHPAYGLFDYAKLLERNGLQWKEDSMRAADARALSEVAALALIMGVSRADHFSEGVLEAFAREGYLDRWLLRLREIDEAREPEAVAPELLSFRLDVDSAARGASLEVSETGLVLRQNIPPYGEFAHSYAFERGILADLAEEIREAASRALASDGWLDEDGAPRFGSSRFALYARYSDGATAARRGYYDRAHMPEAAWREVVGALRAFLSLFGFGEIPDLSGFLSAMKPGEVKYVGVAFAEDGKVYHYRTSDLRIAVGDRVIVPVGARNHIREVTVVSVEYCRWDDTPYPLEQTKEILRRVDDESGALTRLALPGEGSAYDDE